MLSEETRRSSETDALSLVISRLGLDADWFFSGTMCGRTAFDEACGHLHLIRRGPARLVAPGAEPLAIVRPSVVLYTRPRFHEIVADDASGADLVCARISFGGGDANPLLIGLPDRFVIGLEDLPGLAETLTLLFEEAFAENHGNRAAVTLLLQLLLVMLFRYCVRQGLTDTGLLAGLAEPRLARVLKDMHGAPEQNWSVESLADAAGMSRANFAALFRARIGLPPADYLTALRLSIAKRELTAGRPLKAVAGAVGYASTTALSRAFARRFGCNPRQWLERQGLREPDGLTP